MKKATQNYILFVLMLLLSLGELVSGLVLWLILPHGGYQGGRGVVDSFLWSRDIWVGLHNWIGMALVAIVLIHIILHWKWIIYRTKILFKSKK